MSFNKKSKKRTDGALLSAEELILEAAGIEVAVDGLTFVEAFPSKVSKTNVDEILKEIQVENNYRIRYFKKNRQALINANIMHTILL